MTPPSLSASATCWVEAPRGITTSTFPEDLPRPAKSMAPVMVKYASTPEIPSTSTA